MTNQKTQSKIINLDKLFAALLTVIFISSPTLVSKTKAQTLTEASSVGIRGIAPIKIGMTIQEARRIAKTELIQVTSGGEPSCLYYKAKSLKDVSFMVTDERISRIDINNPRVTTLSGAKIGDSETKIKALYPKQIQVKPHKYLKNGRYLVFLPKDREDKNYAIVFETDGKKVTRWRVGKFPEVEWVEGCA